MHVSALNNKLNGNSFDANHYAVDTKTGTDILPLQINTDISVLGTFNNAAFDKFGTLKNNVLTFDSDGLYTISAYALGKSSNASTQLYITLYLNDIVFAKTLNEANNYLPNGLQSTFYARKGDTIKLILTAKNQSVWIDVLHMQLNKIY